MLESEGSCCCHNPAKCLHTWLPLARWINCTLHSAWGVHHQYFGRPNWNRIFKGCKVRSVQPGGFQSWHVYSRSRARVVSHDCLVKPFPFALWNIHEYFTCWLHHFKTLWPDSGGSSGGFFLNYIGPDLQFSLGLPGHLCCRDLYTLKPGTRRFYTVNPLS